MAIKQQQKLNFKEKCEFLWERVCGEIHVPESFILKGVNLRFITAMYISLLMPSHVYNSAKK